MKAVLNETKRILAVMLSVAMIIAAVPQVAFAAPESPSENDAIQTEEDGVANEAAETVVEDAAEEPAEEENTGEKERLDYTEDSVLGVDDYTASTAKAAIFTIAGEDAVLLGGAGSTVANAASFDSLNGTSVYVVPFTGYSLTNSAYTVDGSYQYKDTTSEVIISKDKGDYTVANSDVSYASFTVTVAVNAKDPITGDTNNTASPVINTYDKELNWAAGKKITINKGTTFAQALTDLYIKGTSAFETGYTPEITVGGLTATSTEAERVDITLTGADKGNQTLKATYGTAYTVNLVGVRKDWTNMEAKVTAYKADGTKDTAHTFTSDANAASDHTHNYFYLDTNNSNKPFTLSDYAVSTVYDVVTKGGSVVVSLEKSATETQHSFTVQESKTVAFKDVSKGTAASLDPGTAITDKFVTYDSTHSNSYTFVNVDRAEKAKDSTSIIHYN